MRAGLEPKGPVPLRCEPEVPAEGESRTSGKGGFRGRSLQSLKFCGGSFLQRLGRLALSPAPPDCLWFPPTPTNGTRAVPIHEGHDKAAKRLLRDANMMADALRLCLPADLLDDIDLGTLRLLPAEHVDAELRRRRGDLLWTARLKGGGAAVFPVEAQSTHDERMAARMTTLTGMLYEGIATTLKGPDGRPVAVLPIVLYTGRRRWSAGRGLAELADPSSGFAPYVAGPRYLLLDVGALAAHDLPQRNRMAVLVRLEAARSPEELLEALRDALAWLGDDELGPVFVKWVSEVLMPLRFPEADRTPFDDLQEGVTMLAERAKEWTEQWFAEGRETGLQEGLERGLEQGLEQGRRDIVVRQARLRFGDAVADRLSPVLERIADPAALAEVGDWVIQCRDGAELVARAQASADSGNGR